MTGDHELVLSALGDGRWHTTTGIAGDTGFPTEFIRGALANFALVGWVTRGPASPDPAHRGARSWRITKTGLARLSREKVR